MMFPDDFEEQVEAELAKMPTNSDVLQNDLRELLEALDLPSGAQPRSLHEVFQEALTEVRRRMNELKRLHGIIARYAQEAQAAARDPY